MGEERRKTDNILLVIIDQLRADYSLFLPRISALLPHHAICDTSSIPTSTEAMHTNISTGTTPHQHGFISKDTESGKDGLQQIIAKMERGELRSLATLAASYGFETYALGGKPETVRVMGLEKECALLLFHNQNRNAYELYGTNDELINYLDVLCQQETSERTLALNIDAALLEIARAVENKKNADKSLTIVTLPLLDKIGHEYGPHSPEIKKHLAFLDDKISELIENEAKHRSILVTGDHGCRETIRYVIELDVFDNKTMTVYQNEGEKYSFCESYQIGEDSRITTVHYDGGLLRLWLREDVNELSVRDEKFLSRYGQIIHENNVMQLPAKTRKIFNHSKHSNLGDIIVVSNQDVTFCKRRWIDEHVQSRLRKDFDVTRKELPIGEHGTYHAEDRLVPFLSNYDFGFSRIENTQIAIFIEELMKNNYFGA